MDASMRLQAERLAPLDWMGPLLDRVETPVLLADRRGDVVRANAALARFRARLGSGRSLEAHIVALLAQLQLGAQESGDQVPAAMEKEVVVGGLRVKLLATPLAVPAQAADTLFAVLIEPITPPLPDAAHLKVRCGLSRRQAEVALLLAQGCTNAQVASALRISPHTARRHTERVLGKLGVGRRGGVAQRLLLA
jgi:DNA-binding CsgD family transcriptional regulator